MAARVFLLLVLGNALLAGHVPQGPTPPGEGRPAVVGLDHVPLAVNDLDRAAADYRALGFALKPGRPHANGIRNEHVKFADGTELELITVAAEKDALAAAYRRHLAAGDGPAFLALFAPELNPVARHLEAGGVRYRRAPSMLTIVDGPLAYLFFAPRNHSPTDRPEHFAHANTADSLIGVWLAGNLSRERDLLRRLGATLSRESVQVPDGVDADVARFQEGEVVLLPAKFQHVPGRRIAGLTMRVRSLSAARRVLEGTSSGLRLVHSEHGSSLFLPPPIAHGMWLELREPR